MNIMDQLGVALGLASLAGINLYLTVLIVSCAIHFQWISLSGPYTHLGIFDNPWIIGIAATCFIIEFFADKIPWIDSTWDAFHTFIRPVGGICLALTAIGSVPPEFSVIAALISGSATLATHSAKASSRLAINASPEPISNSILSFTEDALVIGGLSLIATHPFIAFTVFVVIFILSILITIWLWKQFSSLFLKFRRKHDSPPSPTAT